MRCGGIWGETVSKKISSVRKSYVYCIIVFGIQSLVAVVAATIDGSLVPNLLGCITLYVSLGKALHIRIGAICQQFDFIWSETLSSGTRCRCIGTVDGLKQVYYISKPFLSSPAFSFIQFIFSPSVRSNACKSVCISKIIKMNDNFIGLVCWRIERGYLVRLFVSQTMNCDACRNGMNATNGKSCWHTKKAQSKIVQSRNMEVIYFP